MTTQWRKIAGDFREQRLQLCLIGLVLALGTAGVVAALNARVILRREVAQSYRSARSPDVVLWFDKVEPGLLAKVRVQPGVVAVDARRVAYTRVATQNGQWFFMRLIVLRDFAKQELGTIHQHAAAWSGGDSGIFIEQSGRSLLNAEPGDELRIRTPAGGIATLPLAGVVHDTAVAPSTQDRAIYGYITPAAAALIGQSTEFDQLLVKIKNRGDMSDATSFANDLRDWLKANGESPLRADVVPDEHPHAGLMATMLRVLQAFAAIAFICSAALALYMVSLWMKREVRQVGIMKTIGARSSQLAAQYLGLVVPLVMGANVVAWPLGTWLGRWLVRYYETVFNIDVAYWGAPSSLLFKEILCTLGIPLLAMSVPIVRAARMAAREAIYDPGITAPGSGLFSPAKWLRIPGNRQWIFALRNIFRRPWRLAMILLALSAGGALFLTANDTYESLMRVVDVSLGNQGHDVQVQLQRPASAAQLESVARTVPEVETAEAWRTAGVTIGKPGGAESQRLALLGYPTGTRLFRLPIKEGRLPAAGESDAVVVNRLVQNAVAAVRLGSEVELHFRERRVKVRVVGIVEEIGTPTLYAAYPAFEAITALGDVSSLLRVKTAPDAQESVAPALDQALLDAHLAPGNIQTSGEFRKSLEEHFAVVCDVMRMVALAAALVGAISLGASVSLNVLERAREIGVMRALGARPRAVSAIFLLEGGVVALLSGLLAVAASIVLSRGMNQMASRDLLHVAVPLHISASGLAVLGSGLFVVVAAVWLSLRRMLRISVRDALAYE